HKQGRSDQDQARSCAASPDPHKAASGEKEKQRVQWRGQNPQNFCSVKEHSGFIADISFTDKPLPIIVHRLGSTRRKRGRVVECTGLENRFGLFLSLFLQ
ncbi:MAG: hypothetical protein H6860_02115, partial [Rhodospirillales bacterium]|nr:hypothetical protein [Rhodospirillales bacterium]